MSTTASFVWNRACYGGGESPREGDKHLAAVLYFHGSAMNGGVLHAVQFCETQQLLAAKLGLRYFGLHDAVAVIKRAEAAVGEDDAADQERELDSQYRAAAGDRQLSAKFNHKYLTVPNEFAPVQ